MAFRGPREDFRTRPVYVYISAPSFTLPPHTLRRRPRRFRPPAAAVIHNGLSTEKLSTSLLAALCKTFSPSRLRTRIIIYRSPVGRSRGVSAPLWGRVRAIVAPCPASTSAGWGRARAKADAPSRSNPHLPCLRPRTCPPKTPHFPCLRPHCVQRRKCTRQSPLLPVRSSRDSLSTAVPPSADGRSACAFSPATARQRPCPRRLRPNHCVQRRKCTRQSPPLPVRFPRVSPPTPVHFAR